MADDETKRPEITDPYKTPTIFTNQVVGAGFLNGVYNLTFSTAQFTPTSDGKVDPDFVITARLRMDMFCAQQVYEELGKLIQQQVKASGEKPN